MLPPLAGTQALGWTVPPHVAYVKTSHAGIVRGVRGEAVCTYRSIRAASARNSWAFESEPDRAFRSPMRRRQRAPRTSRGDRGRNQSAWRVSWSAGGVGRVRGDGIVGGGRAECEGRDADPTHGRARERPHRLTDCRSDDPRVSSDRQPTAGTELLFPSPSGPPERVFIRATRRPKPQPFKFPCSVVVGGVPPFRSPSYRFFPFASLIRCRSSETTAWVLRHSSGSCSRCLMSSVHMVPSR